jgi:hypothetical protein
MTIVVQNENEDIIDEEELYYVKNGYRRRPLFEHQDIYTLLVDKLKKKNISKLFNIFQLSNNNKKSKSSNNKSKHVMFVDSLGMDLDIVHTIQVSNKAQNTTTTATTNNNNLSEPAKKSQNCIFEFHRVCISKQPIYSSQYNFKDSIESFSLIPNLSMSSGLSKNSEILCRLNEKLLIPKFVLNPDQNYEKLIQENICLNHVEIFDQCSIRGVIFTLTKQSVNNNYFQSKEIDFTRNDENSSIGNNLRRNRNRLSKRFSKLFSFSNPMENLINSNMNSSNHESNSVRIQNTRLDLVYVIWTVDKWKSWKYQAAIQKNCKENLSNGSIIKTHEFFIQNLDYILEIDQTLELIVCHQIDMIVYKDTNEELCYKFKCAYKI